MKTLKFFSYLILCAFSFFILYSSYNSNESSVHNGGEDYSKTIILLIAPFISSILLFGMFLAKDRGLKVFKIILHVIVLIFLFTFFILSFGNSVSSAMIMLVPLICEIFLFTNAIKQKKYNETKPS